MKQPDDQVGAFQAKTHLAELLDRVRHGQTITITKRGAPVAQLVPYRAATGSAIRKRALEQFDKIRAGVRGPVNIRAMIDAGRHH
jgi:prevent-host-death family protein